MSPHLLILRQSEPFPYGWVRQSATALADAGYRVTVIGPKGYEYTASDETIHGVRALRYDAPSVGPGLVGYAHEFAAAMWRMRRLITRASTGQRPDVVMASTPPDFLLLLTAGMRRRGVGVLFDRRDPGPELYEAKFGRRGAMWKWLVAAERYACRHADAIVSPNDALAALLRQRSGADPDRIFTVGNGPDPRRIHPVPPRPALRRGKDHLVVWIGGMSSQDGLDHLVEAIDQLVNRLQRRDVAFSIVGPGDLREHVLADVRGRGLEDVVELPGMIADDDLLRAYMATADVCLSTDERNDLNDRLTMMKVLEYMAMERPVVQFPIAEMRALCGEATAYARDAADLADQVAALLDDPDRRTELGRRARERMLDGLMFPDQVPNLVQAVELARKAGARRAVRR